MKPKRQRFSPKMRVARCDRKIAGYLRQIDRMRDNIDAAAEERLLMLLSMRQSTNAGESIHEEPHGP